MTRPKAHLSQIGLEMAGRCTGSRSEPLLTCSQDPLWLVSDNCRNMGAVRGTIGHRCCVIRTSDSPYPSCRGLPSPVAKILIPGPRSIHPVLP